MNKRRFHRARVTIEILSEQPFNLDSLEDLRTLAHMIETDCSGEIHVQTFAPMSGKEAALRLEAQGSDPAFFNLTSDGENFE